MAIVEGHYRKINSNAYAWELGLLVQGYTIEVEQCPLTVDDPNGFPVIRINLMWDIPRDYTKNVNGF